MQFDLQAFYTSLQEKGIIFCFSGPVSQEVIEGIGETLKQRMELEATDLNTSQKVFSIFVEQMQNIVNYSAERVVGEDRDEGDIRSGVLVVGVEDKHFYVLCGNKIKADDVGPMRQHLELVRSLDKDGLKSLYRERRKMAVPSGNKGTGLGFIDIARKATRPIDFDFAPVDGIYCFFTLKAII